MKEKVVLVAVLVSLVSLGVFIYAPEKVPAVDSTDDAGIVTTDPAVPHVTDAGLVDAGL